MKWIFAVCFIIFALNVAQSLSTVTSSRLNFHEEAQNENFNPEELELLKPINDILQTQYDEIISSSPGNESAHPEEDESHLKDQLFAILQHFVDEDELLDGAFKYNINLPAVSDLKGSLKAEIPSDEVHDMENILQENIDDAHETILELVNHANETESLLLSINKIKILKFIYKRLGDIFSIAIRASRAAYCTYSYSPIINATLTEGRTNIGSCYVYTRNSIKHLRSEVQSSIDTIRANVVELASIYKKITNRQSLFGKLFTLLMNVSKITNDINDSRSTANKTMEYVKTEVPTITATTKECATYSIPRFVNQLNETITGLMTCINFVDDSTQGPEPEPESSEDVSEEADKEYSK